MAGRCSTWSARVLEEVGTDNVLGKEVVGYSPRVSMMFAARAGPHVHGAPHGGVEPGQRGGARRGGIARARGIHLGASRPGRKLAYACGDPESTASNTAVVASRSRRSSTTSRPECWRTLPSGSRIWSKDSPPLRATHSARVPRSLGIAARSAAILPLVLAVLAEAHLALGERTEAVATAREGIDLARAGGCSLLRSGGAARAGRGLAGDGWRRAPRRDRVRPRTRRAAGRVDRRPLIVAADPGAARATGCCARRRAGCRRLLRQALEVYRAIGATGHAERLAKEIGA